MKNRNLGRDKLTKNKSTAQAQNGAGGVGGNTEEARLEALLPERLLIELMLDLTGAEIKVVGQDKDRLKAATGLLAAEIDRRGVAVQREFYMRGAARNSARSAGPSDLRPEMKWPADSGKITVGIMEDWNGGTIFGDTEIDRSVIERMEALGARGRVTWDGMVLRAFDMMLEAEEAFDAGREGQLSWTPLCRLEDAVRKAMAVIEALAALHFRHVEDRCQRHGPHDQAAAGLQEMVIDAQRELHESFHAAHTAARGYKMAATRALAPVPADPVAAAAA